MRTLRQVPRLGDKAFEQVAGFLRIPQGDNPLDASAVHPEAYPVVERILQHLRTDAFAGWRGRSNASRGPLHKSCDAGLFCVNYGDS